MGTKSKVVIRPRPFSAGQVLFKQGDRENKNVYMLNSGKIGVYVDEIQVAVITLQGTFFGETAALLEEARTATCVVLEDSVCTVFPGAIIDSILVQYPKISLNLLKMFASRLRETTKKYTAAQEALVRAKRDLNRIRGISDSADLDVVTRLLMDMGTVSLADVNRARKRQDDLAKQKVQKALPAILVEQGAITMYEMIQASKIEKQLTEK